MRSRVDILPDAQRRLLPQLAPLRLLGWVLYGGTAIALQLGHRTSVDFDFFTDRALDRDALGSALPEGRSEGLPRHSCDACRGAGPAPRPRRGGALFPNFPPCEAVKALTYFEGGDLAALTREERALLIARSEKVGKPKALTIVSTSLSE